MVHLRHRVVRYSRPHRWLQSAREDGEAVMRDPEIWSTVGADFRHPTWEL